MSDTLRLFIGSFVEPDTMTQIIRWREQQQVWAENCGAKVRWVSDEQLHMTWRFLGDTPAPEVPGLQQSLSGALGPCKEFELTFRELAVWPHAKKPQVLVWLANLTPDCQHVADTIQSACGVKAEHTFRPHITLARLKPHAMFRRGAMDISGLTALSPTCWQVQDLHLIESILKPAGAEYRLHQRWVLKPLG